MIDDEQVIEMARFRGYYLVHEPGHGGMWAWAREQDEGRHQSWSERALAIGSMRTLLST